MSATRKLNFPNEDALLGEIALLRKGYTQHGNWSLAQMAWHLSRPLALFLNNPPPPPDLQRTPEQEAKKQAFVDYIVTHHTAPPYIKDAPPSMIPSADMNESAIAEYESLLTQLKAYPHPRIVMGPIGPVTIEEYRLCNLFHAEHHVAFLSPKAGRRTGLLCRTEDDVIADIEHLRQGYTQFGAWSLAQICWHLSIAIQTRMKSGPFPPNTPEQDARKLILAQILATNQLPGNIPAPEPLIPPADAPDYAIDTCIADLTKFKYFPGPIVPHRLFGHMPDPDARRLNLIHCAHHLSFLVPTSPTH